MDYLQTLPVELILLILQFVDEFTGLESLIEASPRIRAVVNAYPCRVLAKIFEAQPKELNELLCADMVIRMGTVPWPDVLQGLERERRLYRHHTPPCYTLTDVLQGATTEDKKSSAHKLIQTGSKAQKITHACLTAFYKPVEVSITNYKRMLPRWYASWDPHILETEYIRVNRLILLIAIYSDVRNAGPPPLSKRSHRSKKEKRAIAAKRAQKLRIIDRKYPFLFPTRDMMSLGATLKDLGLCMDWTFSGVATEIPYLASLHENEFSSKQACPSPSFREYLDKRFFWHSDCKKRGCWLLFRFPAAGDLTLQNSKYHVPFRMQSGVPFNNK
ncbi:hypothetical protein N7492_004724 [Penicillium capsulatum]|uniref:F-box domain-containing protein n=1 Tax=Penicillium capsulatum TaxID=69766 RepID=A0A9W9I8D9_9EURO|nr:hypothetical protein N7492_004724 [Penicillium capsulatum]KAJ6136171.1 hypothetical protein N7512_001331 [Penicillium capsulatum]